jgi:hypothetical protein
VTQTLFQRHYHMSVSISMLYHHSQALLQASLLVGGPCLLVFATADLPHVQHHEANGVHDRHCFDNTFGPGEPMQQGRDAADAVENVLFLSWSSSPVATARSGPACCN